MSESCRGCFLQFAKAPRAGSVKTRLAPAYTAVEGARLARWLTERVATALRARPAGWNAFLCADDPADPFLCELAARNGMAVRAQGEGDLGQRMARALGEALREHEAAIVVGSDCTGYDRDYLRAATRALAGHDAVLGPAQDGGYVLIGLRRALPEVFVGPEWGTATVLEQQRERLQALGLRWTELPLRADIDRPEDIVRQLDAADQALAIGRLSPQA